MHEDFFFMFIIKGIIVLLSLWLDKDKNSARFPFWRERAAHPPRRMGESRLLYVRTKESMQMVSFCSLKGNLEGFRSDVWLSHSCMIELC